jgi:hypothetical protein
MPVRRHVSGMRTVRVVKALRDRWRSSPGGVRHPPSLQWPQGTRDEPFDAARTPATNLGGYHARAVPIEGEKGLERSLRPYRLIRSRPSQARTVCTDWPITKDTFEAQLRDNRIRGRHCPPSLTDEVPTDVREQADHRRYQLQYQWNEMRSCLGVISCNPSTATRTRLDDTLLVSVNQAMKWGFGGIDQCNLSPVYGTDSRLVHDTLDFSDDNNWSAISRVLTNRFVWLAWGQAPTGFKGDARRRWNSAEDRLLGMVRHAQSRGTRLLAQRLNSGAGYKPPGHPNPQRASAQVYRTPLRLSLQKIR